ncbi:hypothetical protein EB241_06245 [Erwinia psidii]|uniref:Uncharacterized protein n=1 Tax=Erwinia psidii TaxID=69224 RepID=A0A3N6S1D0_9GAMM|nr:hypothetical protein EB241_06245 [Erwinia psidii]
MNNSTASGRSRAPAHERQLIRQLFSKKCFFIFSEKNYFFDPEQGNGNFTFKVKFMARYPCDAKTFK